MSRRLRTTLLALGAVLAVVAAAVLLTAPVHALLVRHGLTGEDEFLKVLRRLLLVPLLLLLFGWTKPWRDGGPRSYGLVGERARLPAFLGPYALTLAFGTALLGWHLASGWLVWEDAPFGTALGRALRWVGLGLLLAVIEEWFFRGWLDRRLRRVLPALGAVLAGTAVYGAIHAFKPSRLDVPITHDAAGALDGLLWWLGHLVDPAEFGPRFVGLFLFGLVLLALWRRTGTLWPPIGVHAAGITLLRSYGGVTERLDTPAWAGGKELVDGPVAWVLLALLLVALRPRARPDASPHG